MKNELIDDIQIQIKPYLNQNQYLKLTKILIDEFENIEIINRNINIFISDEENLESLCGNCDNNGVGNIEILNVCRNKCGGIS